MFSPKSKTIKVISTVSIKNLANGLMFSPKKKNRSSVATITIDTLTKLLNISSVDSSRSGSSRKVKTNLSLFLELLFNSFMSLGDSEKNAISDAEENAEQMSKTTSVINRTRGTTIIIYV